MAEFVEGVRQLHAVDRNTKAFILVASVSAMIRTYQQLVDWANAQAALHKLPEGAVWEVIESTDPRWSVEALSPPSVLPVVPPSNPKVIEVGAKLPPVPNPAKKFIKIDPNNELFNEVQADREKKFKKQNELRANIDAQIEAHMRAFKPLG